MRFLERERRAAQALLPGLDEFLAGQPLTVLERAGSPGIEAFRRCGGPGLLVPVRHAGAGATALDAIRAQRAIGARSPSLAVATTMHHFSMATLVALSEAGNGFEWMLMEAVASKAQLIASGFAEGRPDSGILQPTMSAVETAQGVRVTGVKRPCSLARSMDLLTASVRLTRPDGSGGELAVVLIPANSPGLSVSPFWGSFALAGAESDQVAIDGVLVPPDLVVRMGAPAPGQTLDGLQVAGFLWFELLISASYLGAASALVERVLLDERVPEPERARLAGELDAAMAGLENVARQLPDGQRDPELLSDCLTVRYAVQDSLARAVPRAVELLGGLSFITSDDIAYLAASVYGLGFHPPSRTRMSAALVRCLAGQPLTIG
jgi:alkylation response protein AidB-like acyl-CoA dehydrogenase